MEYKLTEQQLKIMMSLLVKEIKKKIDTQYPYGRDNYTGKDVKIASGQLYDSIQYDVEFDTDKTPIGVLYYADYFKYVNRGRPAGLGATGEFLGKDGKKKTPKLSAKSGAVPIPALVRWISIKGINVQGRNGQTIPPLSLAFAMRRNIFKYGIRKTNIYNSALDSIEDIFEDFPNNLPENLRGEAQVLIADVAEDINIFLTQMIKLELDTQQ
jgi:hypothetical protein